MYNSLFKYIIYLKVLHKMLQYLVKVCENGGGWTGVVVALSLTVEYVCGIFVVYLEAEP